MDSILPILGACVLGIIAILFAKKTATKGQPPLSPPKHRAADIANEALRKDFKEEVEAVKRATKGEDPATALADLGNARRR